MGMPSFISSFFSDRSFKLEGLSLSGSGLSHKSVRDFALRKRRKLHNDQPRLLQSLSFLSSKDFADLAIIALS